MKILILEGSPDRKGSFHMLAKEFAKGAYEAGHEVVSISAAHSKISPAEDMFPVVMTNHVCRRMTWSIFGWKFLEPIC